MLTKKRETKFQSERLRLARTARGLTLAELGESLGTTRQYIFQIETGQLRPTNQNLEDIAIALSVDKRFFLKPLSQFIGIEEAHFRHRLTTPDSKKKEVLSKLLIFEEFIKSLEELIALPNVIFPEIHCDNSEDIERAAETTRKILGVPLNKPIGSFSRIIENSGGVITSFVGHDERLDALSVCRTRPIFVILDGENRQSSARVRFDLGHELGHIVMHRGIATGEKHRENEANRFSSAFLMPRASFMREFPRELFRFNWDIIFGVKIKWGVSVAAILRRLFDLQIIDSNMYKRGYIYLSKTGQRKHEKYDDQVAPERPVLIDDCLTLLKDNVSMRMAFRKNHSLDDNFLRKVFGIKSEYDVLHSGANDAEP